MIKKSTIYFGCRIGIAVLLILQCNTSFLQAQEYISHIRYLTTKDGLSSNVVHAIHKDKQGFMWIGTQSGLNHYDGTRFKVYTPENQPGMTISCIHEIFEDTKGYLWLLKKNGNYLREYEYPEINLLNIYTGKMTTIEEYFGGSLPFKVQDIQFMGAIRGEQLVFHISSSPNQLYVYDALKGFRLQSFSSKIKQINGILQQEDGHLLVQGCEYLDDRDWKIYKVDHHGMIMAEQSMGKTLILKDKQQNYPIQLKGISNISGSRHLDAYNYFPLDLPAKQEPSLASAEYIDQSAWNEEQGLFWLKSRGSIRAVKPDGTIVFSLKEKLDEKSIPILFEKQATWLSNKREGLTIIELQSNYFSNYSFFDIDFDNSTRGIYKDKEGVLWVSTIAGFVKFDKKTKTVKERTNTQPFTNFMPDDENNLWYFIWPNLIRHDLETKEQTFYDIGNAYGVLGWAFFKNSDEEIWVTSHNGLLLKVNTAENWYGELVMLPSDLKIGLDIYQFFRKEENQIWLCTSQGLYMVNNNGEYIATYNKEQSGDYFLPAKTFHHLHVDKDSIIWAATGDAGLLKLKVKNKKITLEEQFTVASGLSSNSLHAIYEDDYGYLWISSDDGLMQFDKQSNKVCKYFVENGLGHNEFNRTAHFQGEDGQLYFGGLLGVTTFHPKHFAHIRKAYNSDIPLAISQFRQFSGQEEQFVDLTHALLQTNTIRLQPEDQFFNLKIAMLAFQSDDHCSYSYRIKGVYEWQTTTNGNLSISGLPYGKHILEIKAQNSNQQAAANQLAINIEVLRPFYLQWWFVTLVLLTLILIIAMLVKWRARRLLTQQEAQQLKALDRMKSQFFTNISHELRTPITLIDLPLKQLKKHYDHLSRFEVMQQLDSLERSKDHLKQMVDEILDLSKLESGKLKLEPHPVRLKHFLERVIGAFQSAAQAKAIDYRFSCFVEDTLVVKLDTAKLEMIINNLLSNALKFTPEKGEISVYTDYTNTNELILKVQDSGRGIHPKDLPHIFDRYFQADNKDGALEGGSGIGLAICKEFTELMGGEIQAKSEWQKGTTLSFSLPLHIQDTDSFVEIEKIDASHNSVIQKSPDIQHLKDQPTILIAEDHTELRQHLCKLINAQYNVIAVANGQEALKQLLINPCQLIISDIMMPEVDGFALLEQVRSNPQLCATPFILLTARAAMYDKLQGLRIGVDTYMTKPFDPEELLLNIKNLLANVKARAASDELHTNEDIKAVMLNPETDKTTQSATPLQIVPQDLEWLKEVEQIAIRELKNKNFSINQLPEELFMSRAQVFRKIKKITGLTPRRYLLTIRLQKAKTILEVENPQTLTEVCYAVGLQNTTHFAKIYEEAFGKRPHQLLRNPVE